MNILEWLFLGAPAETAVIAFVAIGAVMLIGSIADRRPGARKRS